MHLKEQTIQGLLSQRLLPLYYHDSPEISTEILNALYDAGIRMVEYTNRGPKALENFSAMKKAATTLKGMELGIGTIKNVEQARAFIDAGADYIVCPTVNISVAEVTHKAGLLWIPGCMTPTEVATAEEAGATVVKIFPGNILGPAYISAIKELFPNIKFMPTGGVEVEKANLEAWFRSGVIAVGMGSKLVSKDRVDGKKYNEIRTETERALKLIGEVIGG